MDYLKYVLVPILCLLLQASCDKKNSKFDDGTENSSIQFMSAQYSYVYLDEIAYFYDADYERLYFIQYDTLIPNSSLSATVSNLIYNSDDKKLSYTSGSDTFFHILGEDIYGLGQLDESLAIDASLLISSGGSYTFNPSYPSDSEGIKCNCFPYNQVPSNCDAGGTGSTSCSITVAGDGCSTDCASSVACCTRDAEFE